MCGNRFDPAVQPERQPETGLPYRLQHIRQLSGTETCHVEDRAELLRPYLIERLELEQMRREEVAVGMCLIDCTRMYQHGLLLHADGVRCQAPYRLRRNHRADIGRRVCRIPHLQALHRSYEHFDDAIGDFLLKIEHTQCRASLTGTGE